MPKIIVTSRYLKSGSKKNLSNYVKYIASREGAVTADNKVISSHATQAQQTLIKQMLNEYPESKSMFEYDDYCKSPTVSNASKLISEIVDRNMDRMTNRKNYVGYLANRPGAVKLGTHGLFNGEDKSIDLEAVAKEVSEHKGNVWTHVVSLRRDNAQQMGYDNLNAWRDLVKRQIPNIAKQTKIDMKNLCWYAAFHDKRTNPHVHIIVYSKDIKEGFLSNKGIEKIRSGFANDIYQDELHNLYSRQTEMRDLLKKESFELMKKFSRDISSTDYFNAALEGNILKLKSALSNHKGKKVYQYLKPEEKKHVDNIFSQLSQNESIQKMYSLWCDMEQQKHDIYSSAKISFPSLEHNQHFKSVKNMIIKTVNEMNRFPIDNMPEMNLSNYEEKDTTGPDNEYGDQVLPDEVDESDTDTSNYIVYSSKFTLKWSKNYKAARVLLYNKDSELVNYLEAEQLLLSEPDNVLSIYELGKLYSTDKLGSKDGDKSDKLYSEALTAFLEIEPSAACISPFESKNINTKTVDLRSYVWHRIGKMYCHGLGDKKNDTEALKWFEKSAVAGNKYAEFSLGSMFYYGNGVKQDYEKALEWYIKSADKGNPYAAYAVAQMYTIGEGADKSSDTAYYYYNQALSGFQKLESEDQADEVMLYKIGRMYMKGLGTSEDIPKAMHYLIRASQLGEKNAKRFIAQEYISGVNIPQDIEKGIGLLKELANYDDKLSAYRLGKIYYDGDVVFHDYKQAEKYLKQVSDENEYAMCILAKLYLREDKKNVSEAIRLLGKACGYESVRSYASYTLAKILLGDNEYHDTAKAIQLLKETADTNNCCSYLLGRLYLFGNNEIEKNIDEAMKWLSISSEKGNQYAQKLLNYNESCSATAILNTVVSLLTNLGRIIEEDNSRRHKNISRTDRKLMRAIQRKKKELGIKSEGIEMEYQ